LEKRKETQKKIIQKMTDAKFIFRAHDTICIDCVELCKGAFSCDRMHRAHYSLVHLKCSLLYV